MTTGRGHWLRWAGLVFLLLACGLGAYLVWGNPTVVDAPNGELSSESNGTADWTHIGALGIAAADFDETGCYSAPVSPKSGQQAVEQIAKILRQRGLSVRVVGREQLIKMDAEEQASLRASGQAIEFGFVNEATRAVPRDQVATCNPTDKASPVLAKTLRKLGIDTLLVASEQSSSSPARWSILIFSQAQASVELESTLVLQDGRRIWRGVGTAYSYLRDQKSFLSWLVGAEPSLAATRSIAIHRLIDAMHLPAAR